MRKAYDILHSAQRSELYGLRRKLDHEQANTNAADILRRALMNEVNEQEKA